MASPPLHSPLMRPPVSRPSLAPSVPGPNAAETSTPGRRPRGLSVQHRKPSLSNVNTTPSESHPTIVTDPGTPVASSEQQYPHSHHRHSGSNGSLTLPSEDQRQEGSSAGASQSHSHHASSASGQTPNAANPAGRSGRKRSSSIVSVQEIHETYDEQLDQEALVNLNTDWVNFRGAWAVHLLLILVGKVTIDMAPITRTMSWTIALQLYLGITFLMFHWVTGTPFSANGGAFDRLTFWEQIDHGAQYTPARKFLTSVPIAFFLLTTHYARYDLHPRLFALNFVSLLLLAVWPKLPAMHRLRFKFFSDAQSASGSGTPDRGNSSRSRASSPSAQLTESSLRNLNLARGSSSSYQYQAQQPPIQEVSEPSTPVLTTSSNWTPARLKSRLFNKK